MGLMELIGLMGLIGHISPISPISPIGPTSKENNMRSQITGLRVASIVFGLIAIAQLIRLVMRPTVLVAGSPMPLWPSLLGFIIMGALSLWMWKLTHRSVR